MLGMTGMVVMCSTSADVDAGGACARRTDGEIAVSTSTINTPATPRATTTGTLTSTAYISPPAER